jgi:glycosyltransferase involved in cell wall biosynthesis
VIPAAKSLIGHEEHRVPSVNNVHVHSTPIVNASRILKQTQSVAQSGLFNNTIICGRARQDLPREEALTAYHRIHRIGTNITTRKASVIRRVIDQISWSRSVYRHYSHSEIDLINAHSVAVLPVCYLLSRRVGASLIYDTHELETHTSTSHGIQGLLFKIIERLLIRKCHAVFVVNESIAHWYTEHYPGLQPIVVRNIPTIEMSGPPVNLRKMMSVPSDKILFIHVGNITVGRNISEILEAFACPTVDAHIVFLGSGQLEALVRQYCAVNDNIHIIAPVPSEQVVNYVSACDVGLCLMQPSCLSYKLCLPNKAFEYSKAGIPFFHTELPEVASLLGPEFDPWRINDPRYELAEAISELTVSSVEKAKQRMAEIQFPSWDEEAEPMIAEYRQIMNVRSGSGRKS